jgi:hypothetical protein
MTLRCAALLVVALCGCGGGAGASRPDEPDCAGRFAWGGVRYQGYGPPRVAVAVGEVLRRGEIRGCASAPPVPVRVVRLRGIDPSIAVGVRADPGSASIGLFGRPGYVVESPLHPLHDAVFLGPDKPVGVEPGFRCGAPFTLRGRVAVPQSPGGIPLTLRTRRGERQLSLHAATTFSGASRHGLPFVGAGLRVRVRTRRCVGTDQASPGARGLHLLVGDAVWGQTP